jgi:hypothetical protein
MLLLLVVVEPALVFGAECELTAVGAFVGVAVGSGVGPTVGLTVGAYR